MIGEVLVMEHGWVVLKLRILAYQLYRNSESAPAKNEEVDMSIFDCCLLAPSLAY